MPDYNVLYDARDAAGKPVLSILCAWTVKARKDGSLYSVRGGKRVPILRRPDGSLTAISFGGVWQRDIPT